VASEAQRQTALQIAQQTPQVSAVKDALAVAGGAGAGSAPPSASPASASARAGASADPAHAAQTALATNPNLAGFVLKAQMVAGRLVLTGRVRTGAEKDLAGVVARDAASAAVENNVIVQP